MGLKSKLHSKYITETKEIEENKLFLQAHTYEIIWGFRHKRAGAAGRKKEEYA